MNAPRVGPAGRSGVGRVARLEYVVQHAGDQAGGDGHQDDVIAGVDIAIATRRLTQAVGIGVAHIVAAIGPRQVGAALPAIVRIARLDPVVAVAGGVPIALAGPAIVAEVVAAAPPVAIAAVPALFTAITAVVAPVVAAIPTEVTA